MTEPLTAGYSCGDSQLQCADRSCQHHSETGADVRHPCQHQHRPRAQTQGKIYAGSQCSHRLSRHMWTTTCALMIQLQHFSDYFVSACAYDDRTVKQCLCHQQQCEKFNVHVMPAGLRQTGAVSA
jgi:hypothetical protein